MDYVINILKEHIKRIGELRYTPVLQDMRMDKIEKLNKSIQLINKTMENKELKRQLETFKWMLKRMALLNKRDEFTKRIEEEYNKINTSDFITIEEKKKKNEECLVKKTKT